MVLLHLWLAVFLSANGLAAPAAGSLDASFDVGTSDYGVNTVLVQPDGKVIIAGTFTYYHSVMRQGIARLNSDASLDPSLDAGNVAGSGLGVRASYLYPDGRILVAGGFYSGARNRIARLNSDGTIDPSFDPGSGPDNDVYCLAVQPDGRILIGGRFASVAGQAHIRLARLNDNGSVDTNFVASADNDVDALALQPDGKILVGGWFTHLNAVSIGYLARLSPDGTVDGSFVTSVTQAVQCLAVQADGKVLIGGYFTFSNGAPVERVWPNGSWDSAFTPAIGGVSWVLGLALQNDGRILVGGAFTTVNGANRPYLARLYADGSTDLSFTAAPDNMVEFISIQPDGRFIVAGGFASVGGVGEEGLARLYGDDSTATPAVQINGAAFRAYQSDPSVVIPVLRSGDTNGTVAAQYATADLEAQAGSDYLPTSGTLTFLPGEVAKAITVPLLNDGQMDNQERFSFFLTNATGAVLGTTSNAAVTIIGANNLVQVVTPDVVTNELAGTLTISIIRAGTNIASSVVCQTIDGTALAGIHYSNLTQTVSFAPGQGTNAITLTLLDDAAPGPDRSFSLVLTNPVGAQIGARSNLSVTILDNDAPGHPAFGVNGTVNAVAAAARGAVVLGGAFLSINGTSRNGIGRVQADESLDADFDPGSGANRSVNALLPQPDGSIVCGGAFTSFNGIPRARLARLLADGSLDNDFDPGWGASSTVAALAPAADGAFFAGGYFTNYGGAARYGVTKINSDGTLNTNFVPQLPTAPLGPRVLCLATQAVGGLLVGCDGLLGNTNVCLRLSADGSRDPTFTNRFTSTFSFPIIYSLVAQPDGKILVGGGFTAVNGVARNNLARLNASGSLDTTFNPSSGTDSAVDKLALLDNGQIVAVGGFRNYAGVSRNRIVRLNANGSIDLTFDPGTGANSTILDVAPLPGNRLAIGGFFRAFAGVPRYNFAILDAGGHVVSHIGFESFAVSDHLTFGARFEPELPFELLGSSNLVNWQVLYSNVLHQDFTNLALPKTAGLDRQFFRLLSPP